MFNKELTVWDLLLGCSLLLNVISLDFSTPPVTRAAYLNDEKDDEDDENETFLRI